ncbi:xylulokinase [Melioribacter sp. OK-6-Me]|uniref:xylulokinase n=1 Tax=unclassified Melioribacter TaxID=2627329 RepID=UPI003ED9BA24
MVSIGYDIGSSSIKCSLFDVKTGRTIDSDFHPKEEMKISSPKPGWAEQNPETWWEYAKLLTKNLIAKNQVRAEEIKSIGISYQMHGLVLVDRNMKVLRPSVIWCDSRAVETGNNAFVEIGKDYCLNHLLNSPGNFTASKLKWVKDNEPDVYEKIFKAMLPGDFIAMKLTGEIATTVSGLSEGIFWDFKENDLSEKILEFYGIDKKLLPEIVPTFSIQGKVLPEVAEELGLNKETVVSYRAGDQPNNAFSLNVLNPGEIAATAGTSGVVYAVIDRLNYDDLSRVNQFAHVNHTPEKPRIGVLLCINGTGIMNSYLRKNMGEGLSYEIMNQMSSEIKIGSEGLVILPFGNGAERVFENKNIGAQFLNIDLNRHTKAHFFRAAQEGIAFTFKYGIDIIRQMGLDINVIRAGKANMFLSPIFKSTFSNIIDATVELYDTDGSVGAARGAALGAGLFKTPEEAFRNLTKLEIIEPNKSQKEATEEAYGKWLENLKKFI